MTALHPPHPGARRGLLLAILVVFSLTSSARAAEIGSTSASATAGGTSTVGSTFVQILDGGGPSYMVPAGGGIITSWRVVVGTNPSAAGGTVALKLFRPQSGGSYLVTASDPRSVTVPFAGPASPAPAATSFTARIPVAGGERLGGSADANAVVFVGPETGASFGNSSGAAAVGATFTPGATQADSRLLIAATLEPDADKDGFGDTTQDKCLNNPRHALPCIDPDLALTIGGKPSRVKAGKSTTLTVRVRERRGGPSNGVRVAVALPEGFSVRSAKAQGGTCHGRGLLICRLGKFNPRTSKTISVKLTARSTGRHRAVAAIIDGSDDHNSKNDSAAVGLVVLRRR